MAKSNSPLPARLKAARLAAGLSQKALGMRAGIDEFVASVRINQYERGVHAPTYSTARALALALDVPTAFLFADDDELAELLLGFHAMSRRAKLQLLRQISSTE